MSGSESKRKMSKRITGRQNSKDQILNFCAALRNTIAILHVTGTHLYSSKHDLASRLVRTHPAPEDIRGTK